MQDEDDIELQSYQDDLNSDDNATDPIMSEETDDPTKDLGVPPEELKEQLGRAEFDDDEEDYVEEPGDRSDDSANV